MAGRSPDALLAELGRLETLRNPTKGGDSNRLFQRHVARGDVELHPDSRSRLDRTPVEVKLRDVGRGGIGFISHQHLPAGSSWRACFMQHGFVVASQSIVVRHCRLVSEGVYLVGTQFVCEPGLLAILGVDPGAIEEDDTDVLATVGGDAFVAPSDVA